METKAMQIGAFLQPTRWRIREIFLLALVLGTIFIVALAYQDSLDEEHYLTRVSSVMVSPPKDPPPLGQESIDQAIAMFGIKIPNFTEPPRYEHDLVDRGITTRSLHTGHNQVAIGPAAFSSWALLGSTIAHEVEVHCRQSFFMVWLLDSLGLGGTHLAERLAYQYELKNSHRFGLGPHEDEMIQETLEFYYPMISESVGIIDFVALRWPWILGF